MFLTILGKALEVALASLTFTSLSVIKSNNFVCHRIIFTVGFGLTTQWITIWSRLTLIIIAFPRVTLIVAFTLNLLAPVHRGLIASIWCLIALTLLLRLLLAPPCRVVAVATLAFWVASAPCVFAPIHSLISLFETILWREAQPIRVVALWHND